MKRLQYGLAGLIAASFIFYACGQPVDSTQEPPGTASSNTGASVSITKPPTIAPTSTIPPTPTIFTCEPRSVEFCVTPGTFLLQNPIALPATVTVDRTYAYASTSGGTREAHHGVEFYNGTGTPVLAAGDGVVYYSGDDSQQIFGSVKSLYGNLVILKHVFPDQTLYTLYAHLSKIFVTTNAQVRAGELVGEVGASGSAIGSHLHFEVRLDPLDYDSTLNPELWLIPAERTGVLAVRSVDAQANFVDIHPNLQYYPSSESTFIQAWQPEGYATSMLNGNTWENLVLGNLPGGRYRLTYLWKGLLVERWLEIEPEKLTLLEITLP
jgi:murein DD-endopeptidase MepM/ murein hydrolase activator NlpD